MIFHTFRYANKPDYYNVNDEAPHLHSFTKLYNKLMNAAGKIANRYLNNSITD